MEDFLLKYGNAREGLKHALLPIIFLVVIPVAIIQFILINPNSILQHINDALRGLLNELMVTCLLIGILVVPFGFLRGFYPKGTYSRLVFSMVEAGLFLLYSAILLFSSRLPDILQQIDYQLDLSRLFIVSLYLILSIEVAFVTEYPWNRKQWLMSIGEKFPEIEAKPYKRSMEYSLKLGVVPEANGQARIMLFIFIILPVLLILIVPSLVGVFITIPTTAHALQAGLKNAADAILLLGVPLLTIAWFYGFYKKGSFGRLTMGLAFAAFLALFIFLVLMTSNLKQGLIDLGVHFNYDLFVTLLLIVPSFVGLGTLGEMVDERNAWRLSLGLPVKSKPLNLESWLLDFNPRIGKIGDGTKLALRAYILFLIVPAVILTLISGTVGGMDIQNSSGLASALNQVLDAVILFGIIIVILSFFRGFYPKGTFARALIGLFVTVAILMMLQAAFLNGGLERAFLNSGAVVDLGPVLFALLLYASVGFIGVLAELLDNRRGWAKSIGKKVKPLAQDKNPGPLTDFRLRYAKFVKGTKESKKNIRKYVIWPTIILVIAIAALKTFNNSTLNQALPALLGLFAALLAFALPVIVLQFFRGAYPRGSLPRLAFGLVAVAFIALWYNMFWGGFYHAFVDAIISPEIETYIGHYLSILSSLISILILIPAVLKAIWYTLEFFLHRREWANEKRKLIDEERPLDSAPISEGSQVGQ